MAAPVADLNKLGRLELATLERRSERKFLPWTGEALVRLAIGDGVALFLIVLSWYEASGTVSTSTSVAWFKAGIVGLVVAGTSNALWLLRGRKAVGLARVALLEQFAPVGATDT